MTTIPSNSMSAFPAALKLVPANTCSAVIRRAAAIYPRTSDRRKFIRLLMNRITGFPPARLMSTVCHLTS
jgi:hypothetical protein